MVLDYDLAIRRLQAQLIKKGMDFKKALEAALGDGDTRTLAFTAPFGMRSHLPECRALTAPGLREIHGTAPSGCLLYTSPSPRD